MVPWTTSINEGDKHVNFKTRAVSVVGALVMAGGMAAYVAPAAANAADTPAGACIGSKSLGKLVPGLGDQTAAVTVTTSLLTDLSLITPGKIGGVCGGVVVPVNNPGGAVPGSLHPKAIATKLTGFASCAQGDPNVVTDAAHFDATRAQAYPLNGKEILTMTELDGLAKPWQIQTYVTIKGFKPGTQDVVEVTGIDIKGPSVGATVSGTLYEDPVSKYGSASNPGPVGPAPAKPWPSGYTGYTLDILTGNPLGCTNTTPGDVTLSQIQVGDGTSLLGSATTGISFTFIGAT
jgi:hypothetical protein